jgi:hypothetical protein
MGDVNSRLIRVPNAECWIEKSAVVAVARMNDVTVTTGQDKPGKTAEKITMLQFKIQLAGFPHAIDWKHHDRKVISDFLNQIGVTWDA